MAEFDEKLNSLLSDPEALGKIMSMAQSLMGGQSAGAESPPSGQGGFAPPSPPPPGMNMGSAPPPGTGGNGGASPFGSDAPMGGQTPWGGNGPPYGQGAFGGTPAGNGPSSGPDLSFLSGLGSIDPKTLSSLLPLLRELGSGQNSNARQLLFALRPYLKPERQEKVERALQLARLFHVGKRFLLKGERYV